MVNASIEFSRNLEIYIIIHLYDCLIKILKQTWQYLATILKYV